jgi:hypothetical protein
MNKQFFWIFIVIVLLNNFYCRSQNVSDTIRIISIETIYGDTFTGLLVSENQADLILRTETLGEISIPKDQIKSRKNLKTPKNFDPNKKYKKEGMSDKELLNLDLEKGKKLQKTGAILTISGITAIVVGLPLMEHGYDEGSPDTNANDYWTGTIGTLLLVAGIPVTCVGIPVLLGGTAKKNEAKKKLQVSLVNIKTPVSSNSVKGLSFKLIF